MKNIPQISNGKLYVLLYRDKTTMIQNEQINQNEHSNFESWTKRKHFTSNRFISKWITYVLYRKLSIFFDYCHMIIFCEQAFSLTFHTHAKPKVYNVHLIVFVSSKNMWYNLEFNIYYENGWRGKFYYENCWRGKAAVLDKQGGFTFTFFWWSKVMSINWFIWIALVSLHHTSTDLIRYFDH